MSLFFASCARHSLAVVRNGGGSCQMIFSAITDLPIASEYHLALSVSASSFFFIEGFPPSYRIYGLGSFPNKRPRSYELWTQTACHQWNKASRPHGCSKVALPVGHGFIYTIEHLSGQRALYRDDISIKCSASFPTPRTRRSHR